ncbi:MAG: replication-associated recombination protein A [Bdellovibrionaceae bacterium]|nr:replication-associated recombination protein A [Pseudobdellovibrionaceae bacterium]
MDLFSHAAGQMPSQSPLSERLRPKSLDQIVGQDRTIGVQSRLGKLIRSGHIPSLILWGPPGTGKTTFALALAQQTGAFFMNLNAVDSGAKALREAGESGRERRLLHQQRTVLFVDEIHRFNRAQQDVLLPYVEKGDLILVGATTENPSYELNRALLSRCRVVVFERLADEALQELFRRAFESAGVKPEDILGAEAVEWMIASADGDGRRLLNSIEVVLAAREEGASPLSTQETRELVQDTPLAHDKSSEMHYDLVSAFIKSVRGSDPDAAVYYLTRMLEGGEDPIFIARRLVILASEDIGNADPRGLSVAVADLQAVEAIGLPEGGISLAQVTTYLASAPKSNRSYMAFRRAQEIVRKTGSVPVPLHLRSSKTELSKSLGYGQGYQYPHERPKAWAEQSYLPSEVVLEEGLYQPANRGFEKNILDYLAWVKGEKTPLK